MDKATAVKPWERTALLALLGVATVLRVYKIDAPLWFDEVMTLAHFVRLPFSELVADYSSFNNHLFYSLQAKAVVLALGESAWALRLPALIFGIAGIWALWRLARTALPAAPALTAAALLAVSYHHIWFSQNARGYTELMLWSLLALLVYVRALGSRSWWAWGLFAVALAAAMYTHLTAGFFIAALGLVYVASLTARWARLPLPETWLAPADRGAQFAPLWGFIAGGVLTLLLCAPAVPQMLSLIGAVNEMTETDLMREFQNPVWTLLEGLRTMSGPGGLMLIAAPPALIVAGMGAVDLFKRSPAIAAVAILHIVVTLVGLIAMQMRLWPRFFFTDIAFMLLFVANGAFVLARLLEPLARRLRLTFATAPRLFALGAAIMLAGSAVMAARNYTAPKQDFDGPVALLAERGAARESVGAISLASEVYVVWPKTDWPTVTSVADLAALRPTDGRRWAVMIFPSRMEREKPDVMQALARDFFLLRAFPGTLGDGAVLVYESKPPPR